MNLANLVVGHPEGGRALHDEGGWHTWADVRAGAAAAALALERAGVGPGDRVALAMPASAGFVAAYLGILAAGAVAVPVNPAVPAPELARELGAVSPAVVLGAAVAAGPLRDAAGALRHGVEVLLSDGGHGDRDVVAHDPRSRSPHGPLASLPRRPGSPFPERGRQASAAGRPPGWSRPAPAAGAGSPSQGRSATRSGSREPGPGTARAPGIVWGHPGCRRRRRDARRRREVHRTSPSVRLAVPAPVCQRARRRHRRRAPAAGARGATLGGRRRRVGRPPATHATDRRRDRQWQQSSVSGAGRSRS